MLKFGFFALVAIAQSAWIILLCWLVWQMAR